MPLSEQGFGCPLNDNQCASVPVETNSTLALYDSPADDCLQGGTGAGCEGHTATSGVMEFEDYLVGIVPCSNPGVGQCNSDGFGPSLLPIPFEYNGETALYITWTDSFNGEANDNESGSGGIALGNLIPVDAGSGSGGVVFVGASVPEAPSQTMMFIGFAALFLATSWRRRAAVPFQVGGDHVS